MILALSLLGGLAAAWVLIGLIEKFRLGLGLVQALLYVPFKLAYRITDDRMKIARTAKAPVIYVISHQSRLEPALMLSLLEPDTLHILDPWSAKSPWLEPWRELARTIAFNAEHVFVSRRLVRVLKGNGRLAVYLPDAVEPDVKAFRLYRAVARIAMQADARIVPIYVGNARNLPFSLSPADKVPRRWFPRLTVSVLEPMTIAELVARAGETQITASNALFDRVAETRLAATDLSRGLFYTMRDAADRIGSSHPIIEDVIGGSMRYKDVFIGARVLGRRFEEKTAPGDVVGVLLPNANGVVLSLVGLWSAGRTAAMINYTAGPASVTSAIRTAVIRTVVSSRAFIDKAGLADIVAAVEEGGAKFLWLEELRDSTTTLQKATSLLWRYPLQRQDAAKPAVILFTSGSEGMPKAVVLSHKNLLANAMQAEARITLSPADTLLNVLPVFHSFGLTGGTILPLVTGVKLFLYPSPLHYKIIPEIARKRQPTVLFGTDTFLANYAHAAKDGDFSSLRFIVAGAEPVKQETRRVYRERFGVEIIEGFGLTEAAPVVAVNTAIHGRDGTVGRLLPGMHMRLEPVEGISEGGRLQLSGPNLMMGTMSAERPGEIQPLADGWHDTGDIVSVDREGFVTIRGRAKRFAKIAGEMVSLGAVEMLVQSLWPQEHHAVVAVPDKRRGERIVLVTTAGNADVDALHKFGKQAGAAEWMVPHDIVKVAELPLLGSGKTDYASARQLALEKLGA